MHRLTKTQRDILLHRLRVPDGIAVALEEIFPDSDAVWDAVLRLRAVVETHVLPEPADELEREVLEDCVAGSTWLGQYEYGSQEWANARRPMLKLAEIMNIHPGELPA